MNRRGFLGSLLALFGIGAVGREALASDTSSFVIDPDPPKTLLTLRFERGDIAWGPHDRIAVFDESLVEAVLKWHSDHGAFSHEHRVMLWLEDR